MRFDRTGSHRLTQNGCPGPRHFSRKLSRKHCSLDVSMRFHVHVDCAGPHKKDGARPFPVNSRVNRFFDMSMCISTAQTRIKQLSRLHHNLARFICCTFKGPSGIWKCWPRSCDDFVHVLMKSSGTILYKFVIVCVRRFGEDLAYLADIV